MLHYANINLKKVGVPILMSAKVDYKENNIDCVSITVKESRRPDNSECLCT